QSIWNALTGTAAPRNRSDHLDIRRVHLEVARNADGPAKFASCKPLAELCAHSIAGIRQYAAKPHPRRNHTIDLRQGNLRLRPCGSIFDWHARSLQSNSVIRPAFGKEQPHSRHDRHFAARQRQRYEGLTVGDLAQRRAILRSNTDRMRTLLEHRRVVDHQHGVPAADELICLNKQLCLHRSHVPHPGRDKVVQLVIGAKRKTLGHRLNALAIAWTDQSRYVNRTHPTPRLVTQSLQKRLQPALKLLPPIQYRASHGRPSKSRLPMNHCKTDLGIQNRPLHAEICQSSARPRTHKFERCGSRRLTSALPREAAEERTSRQVREAP